MIIVYTKPGFCQQCDATKRALTKRGLTYIESDLYAEENAHVLEVAKARGMSAAPIVCVQDDATSLELAMWSGFRPDLIRALEL